jgi:hypothetical protein
LGWRFEYFGCCRKSFILGKKERDLRFGCCSRLSDLGIVEKSFKFERGKRERERERERERDLRIFGCLLDVIEKSLQIWESAK